MSGNNKNKRAIAWGYISANERFTVSDIAVALDEPVEKGREIVKEFERRGFIEHVAGIGVAGRPNVP